MFVDMLLPDFPSFFHILEVEDDFASVVVAFASSCAVTFDLLSVLVP